MSKGDIEAKKKTKFNKIKNAVKIIGVGHSIR